MSKGNADAEILGKVWDDGLCRWIDADLLAVINALRSEINAMRQRPQHCAYIDIPLDELHGLLKFSTHTNIESASYRDDVRRTVSLRITDRRLSRPVAAPMHYDLKTYLEDFL